MARPGSSPEPAPGPEPAPPTRHVVSINDLSLDEINGVFELADAYLRDFGDAAQPSRIARSASSAAGAILATLFYEPSTRTRLSFESAMLRLGGKVITSADPAVSSAAKGESLADTVRILSAYADAIVIRHPRDGAARLAAEYAAIPVINGGDGSHEHPTQTLCDLYTLLRENGTPLDRMNVAVAGDLQTSRTIHSLVYALARFGARITLLPAGGMALPDHVYNRLREEFHLELGGAGEVDAVYLTPSESHQLALVPRLDVRIEVEDADRIDAVYVTRFQKERWNRPVQEYTRVDADFLSEKRFEHTKILHPLPRVGEIDISLDADPRAVYFKQAAYGVPIRMALLSLLLHAPGSRSLALHPGGFDEDEHAPYRRDRREGLRCANGNCISRDEEESRYTGNKFRIRNDSLMGISRLRCAYCETDVDRFVIGDTRTGAVSGPSGAVARYADEEIGALIFFEDEPSAKAAGFRSG